MQPSAADVADASQTLDLAQLRQQIESLSAKIQSIPYLKTFFDRTCFNPTKREADALGTELSILAGMLNNLYISIESARFATENKKHLKTIQAFFIAWQQSAFMWYRHYTKCGTLYSNFTITSLISVIKEELATTPQQGIQSRRPCTA